MGRCHTGVEPEANRPGWSGPIIVILLLLLVLFTERNGRDDGPLEEASGEAAGVIGVPATADAAGSER